MKNHFLSKGLLIFSIGLLASTAIVGCANQPTVQKLESFYFWDSVLNVGVGQTAEAKVQYFGLASLDDISFSEKDGKSGISITTSKKDSQILVKGEQAGTYYIEGKVKDNSSVTALLKVVVTDSSSETREVEVDSSKAKTTYLKGEKFDSSNLLVTSYNLNDSGGKDENSLAFIPSYSLSIKEGDILNTLGDIDVTVSTDVGDAKYTIHVVESIQSKSLSIQTNNSNLFFKRGSTFTLNGITAKVIDQETVLSQTGIRHTNVKSEENIPLSSLESSIPVGQKLDENGHIEVTLKDKDGNSASYIIEVYDDDSTMRNDLVSLYNTKNSGMIVSSNIPLSGSPYGIYSTYTFKPYYFVKQEYAKSSRNDVPSKDKIASISGVVQDKNSSVYSYDLKQDNVEINGVLKNKLGAGETWWNYKDYAGVGTFKDFVLNDIPTHSIKNGEHYYEGYVVPTVDSNGSYDTSLSGNSIVSAIFGISQYPTSLYPFVSSYEIFENEDKTLTIRLNVSSYGYIQIQSIPQKDNLDVESVNSAHGQTLSFQGKEDQGIDNIVKAIKGDNYVVSTKYQNKYDIIDYFTPNYLVSYVDSAPEVALAGLNSKGYLKVTNPTPECPKPGIYYFQPKGSPGNLVIEKGSITVAKLSDGTELYDDKIKYTDSFTKIVSGNISGYLSYTMSDVLDNTINLSSFSDISGGSYFSKNADVGKMFMSQFFSSTQLEAARKVGYIYGAISASEDVNKKINSFNIYAVNGSFSGYQRSYQNVGDTKVDDVEDYLGLSKQ